MTRYQHLASLLAERIEQGLYRPGEKLPSLRSLSQNTASASAPFSRPTRRWNSSS